jgi:hypothetical protein
VEVTPPSQSRRGALGRALRDAVDAALERRGAPGPGLSQACDDIEALSDRLYRARLVELRGIALWLPTLEGIAGPDLTLETADSDVLRRHLHATREKPLWLYLDDANRRLGVYTAPVPLNALVVQASTFIDLDHSPLPPLTQPTGESPEPPPASEPRWIDSRLSVFDVAEHAPEPSDLDAVPGPEAVEPPAPFDATESDDPPGAFDAVATPEPRTSEAYAELEAPEGHDAYAEREPAAEPDAPKERGSTNVAGNRDLPDATEAPEGLDPSDAPESPAEHEKPAEHTSEPSGYGDDEPEISADLIAEIGLSDPTPEPASTTSHDEPVSTAPRVESARDVSDSEPPSASPAVPAIARAPREDAFSTVARAKWEGWIAELERARGPKPLSVVERMFVSAYIPLQQAVLRGIGDDRADSALSAWSQSFAQSYSEAFNAFRARGKRPNMVLDVPELALRIGKLHGARSVELIMVTSMRFDLGLCVYDEVQGRVKGRGALVEKTLLWAALPTTTPVQLELLAKGEGGLKEPLSGGEFDVTGTRGSNAHGLRRIKALHRELYRLDSIQAHFSEPGGPLIERMDATATETGALLAEHLNALAPRTLALIFGDHGFLVDPLHAGTSSARAGGASPEETLVPAFAWLRGAVH